eukprot:TRINITY_DN40693_c0_g1_i1.p2 TRINITY_DN40693_c0_g1~~TRINITY_DN40693_c0_g1_i1.p2  ORF type:complete len:125 (+),score=2.22 TRINITY_DN40693_c0_g1_i1:1-375(+)
MSPTQGRNRCAQETKQLRAVNNAEACGDDRRHTISVQMTLGSLTLRTRYNRLGYNVLVEKKQNILFFLSQFDHCSKKLEKLNRIRIQRYTVGSSNVKCLQTAFRWMEKRFSTKRRGPNLVVKKN